MKPYILISILLTSLLLSISCKKEALITKHTVIGRLLESSSNPIPVKNYKISLHQNSSSWLLGSVSGVYTENKTDDLGNFNFHYSEALHTGFAFGNTSLMYIEGMDSLQNTQVKSRLYGITPNIDTNLNDLYLYKNINQLAIKVQFNSALNAGDTLKLIVSYFDSSISKYLIGPFSAGVTLLANTITNYKTSQFNLKPNQYNTTLSLYRPNYNGSNFYNNFQNIAIPSGDESYREISIAYP